MSPEARSVPRAVVAMEKGAQRLVAVNGAAAALGLAPGLALADARARHPALEVSAAEPQNVARILARIADACERYTPLVSLDGADGLVLDVTGCAHLFGGEEGLVRDLLRRVSMAGLSGRAALAATSGAAFALARFAAGRGGVVVPPEEDLSVLLAPLPLAALRLDGPAVEALARLGFNQVGDLEGKPRAPLTARFGADLLRRRDEALGLAPTAVTYRFPPPVFCAERALPEPVERVEDVLGLVLHLATALDPALERQGMGARRLDLTLFRVDGQVTRLAIGTSRPLRDPPVVRRLFAEKVATLSSLDPGFGFELVRLAVREAAPLSAVQEGLGAVDDGAEALDALVDRLATRFGTRQVQRFVLADRHVPEEACHEVPAQTRADWNGPTAWGATSGANSGTMSNTLDLGVSDGRERNKRALDLGRLDPRSARADLGVTRAEEERAAPDDPAPALPAMSGEPAPLSPAGASARLPELSGARAASSPQKARMVEPLSAAGRWRAPEGAEAPELDGPARPLRLLERPEPVEAVAEVPDGPPIRFRWRRVIHTVARAEGPERIAAEWWRSAADLPTRDYYRVETVTGHRFWLFRAGLYGTGADAPAWFLHGLFG